MSHHLNLHAEPHQCLENLDPQWTDGGREEYLEQQRILLHYEPETPTGDCVVVALVHAQFDPPTGQAYRNSKDLLTWSIKPWMYNIRRKNEKKPAYFMRRAIQWFRPPEQNPIHLTPSHATAGRLQALGYQLIYPNDEGRWHCICDETCAYVLDIQIPLSDHTLMVHQMVAYTTAPFDPKNTEVVHVHKLNEIGTSEFKAWARYRKAENLWYEQWAASEGEIFPKWDSKPKLEDYKG